MPSVLESCVAKDRTSEIGAGARIAVLQQIFPEHAQRAQAILERLAQNQGAGRRPSTRHAYLLCMTPRSGSSMLSDVLGKTGTIGPANEHFCAGEDLIPSWMNSCGGLDDVLASIEENISTGYFGIKGDLFQMFPLISGGVFTGPGCIFKHIYLTRKDHVAQAISLARAVKTNEWHSINAPAPDPELSMTDIAANIRYLRGMEADWETVFTVLQIEPLRLCYEDLVADPGSVFERIRQHLDVTWHTDPLSIASSYQSLRARHDAGWQQSLESQFAPAAN